MTPQQMIDFDARREAVLRHQLKTNPNLRTLRRDRRVAFAAGVVRYFAALGILMFLVKAFLISQVGVSGYELIVSPLAAHLPPGGLMEQAVAPGPYSILIAETFSSWMEGNWTRQTGLQGQTGLEGIERIGPGSSNS